MHWKMSQEFLEYNFRCSVARAQAEQASCTPILSASGTIVSGSVYVQVHTGAEDAPKLNVVIGGVNWLATRVFGNFKQAMLN